MINPIRPWPSGVPGTSGFGGVSGFSGVLGASGFSGVSGVRGPSGFSGYSGTSEVLSAAAASLMPAVVDRIMGNRPSSAPTLLCRTCGHEWGNHQDGRCAHLFGMEGDFAHVCGCSPDERGEVAEAVGSAAAVTAAAAAIMALYR